MALINKRNHIIYGDIVAGESEANHNKLEH